MRIRVFLHYKCVTESKLKILKMALRMLKAMALGVHVCTRNCHYGVLPLQLLLPLLSSNHTKNHNNNQNNITIVIAVQITCFSQGSNRSDFPWRQLTGLRAPSKTPTTRCVFTSRELCPRVKESILSAVYTTPDGASYSCCD